MKTQNKKKNKENITTPKSNFFGFDFSVLTFYFPFALSEQKGLAQSVNIRGCEAERKVPTFRSPRTSTAGFSFIEALVAISILVTSIAGPMTIAQRGLTAATISVDQITAFYLGQEAIEAIRHIRDGNVLSARGWMSGLTACFDESCTLDVTQNNLMEVCSDVGACDAIKRDTSTGLYGYDSRWEDSKFTRDIQMKEIAPNEVSVDVYVSWANGFFTKSIVIHGSLFNWQ